MSSRKVVIKVIDDKELLDRFDIPSDYAGRFLEVDMVEILEETHYIDKVWGFIFPQCLIKTTYEPDELPKGTSIGRTDTTPS